MKTQTAKQLSENMVFRKFASEILLNGPDIISPRGDAWITWVESSFNTTIADVRDAVRFLYGPSARKIFFGSVGLGDRAILVD